MGPAPDLDVLYPACCGLDVHKRLVVACLIVPDPSGRPCQLVRSFGTTTDALLALSDWLTEAGCTHVAMESTGVYWQPVWNLLEDAFSLLLVNPRHMKAVPGRKTDVRDCVWIATLLRRGLLTGSVVPPRRRRDIRALVRYRTALTRERATGVNRLQKLLEEANIKLASVLSDLRGVSARRMLQGLIEQRTPAELAELAVGRARHKQAELARALTGQLSEDQRFATRLMLGRLDQLDTDIDTLSERIRQRLQPDEEARARLVTIPGVGDRIAEVILTELGTDLSRFPTAAHLASWAGLCPGNRESAGKRLSGRTRPGNAALRTALVEAAHAASRAKDTALAGRFARLVGRRGRKRAAVAVAHQILVIVYHLLTEGAEYHELGADYLERRNPGQAERRLVKKLVALGYRVTLEKVDARTAGEEGQQPLRPAG